MMSMSATGFHGKQDNTRGCVGVGIFKTILTLRQNFL